jgi:hypothetical protein
VQLQQGFAGIGIKIPKRMIQVEKKVGVLHKPFRKFEHSFTDSKPCSVKFAV